MTDSREQALLDRIAELEQQVETLQAQNAWMRKKIFGKMSEKHLPKDPAQLSLFPDLELSEEEKAAVEKAVRTADENIRRSTEVQKSRPARKPLDLSGLPVQEEHIYPQGCLSEDGTLSAEYAEIGTEESCRLERIPARAYVHKTIRHKVILRSDLSGKLPEQRKILIAEMPLMPIPKCMAGASVLTDIIIGKFMYHLPFHRQIQQYKECGISLSNSTIGDWYESAVDLLRPLYQRLKSEILSSGYIQVDESTIPVIDNEKHMARKGYEWCVRDALTGNVMFHYDRGSRSYDVARELLGNYHGICQTDGYGAYDQFEQWPGIVLVGCWAHARRKFTEALDEDRKLASEALAFISALYGVESRASEEDLDKQARAELRRKEAYPLICAFEKWLENKAIMVLPKSRMGKAISYTYALLPRLSRYVNHGEVRIDNNLIENAIRPLAIGRKNYLFCGNDASACRAAIVYSLIGTCKSSGVDPRVWMEDVMRKLPYYRKENRDISDLLPMAWAKRKQPNQFPPE